MDNVENKKRRPCCVCSSTKKIRDKCIMINNEENCKEYINSHNDCLRFNGFKVSNN